MTGIGDWRAGRWGLVLLIAGGVAAPLTTGCGGKKKPAGPSTPTRPVLQEPVAPPPRPQTRPTASRRGTLYDRMGGEPVVRAVVEDFVSRAAADPAVNFTRQGQANAWQATPQNVEKLKQRLVEFVSTTAGGPMQYRGADMVTAHRGMAVTNAEFDALAGHLRAALDSNGVSRRERDELLAAVASMRGAVVEVADTPPPQPEAPNAAEEKSEPNVDPTAPDAAPEPSPESIPDAKGEPAAPEVTPEQPKSEETPSPEPQPAPAEPGATEQPDQPKSEGSAAEPAPAQDAPAPQEPKV